MNHYTIEYRDPKPGERYLCDDELDGRTVGIYPRREGQLNWTYGPRHVIVSTMPTAEVIQVTDPVRALDGVTILEAPFYATRMDDADGHYYYYCAATYRIHPGVITSWKDIVNE